ncbi:hypothetical protein CSAL01_10135 [Colletotrichum salicis]|uniref:Uncharacterized protein n=1 Tax=Colletotrichum salicis TaxID=1209931 RepID=A0A135RQM5_9PEZI|nr:hypothetical protein CSAL01_10135 [Colletotrichum salicis]
MFPLIYLLLLQAASLTLGAPQRAPSLPRRKVTSLDADINGDGEERLREIFDRPYSTRHRDGSNSNKPFKDIRFSESEGRARWTRANVINVEASRSAVEGHVLDEALVQRHGIDDDSEGRIEHGADEIARRFYEQGTLEDADIYSNPTRRDVEDDPWNPVLRDGGSSEGPFAKPKFREGQGGFVQCAGCSDTRGGSNGWKRSLPRQDSASFAQRTNTNETRSQHPADLLDTLDRNNASPLAWDLPTSQAPTSSLQERGATDWTCNRMGQKNTNEALSIMYDVFNNVFGTEPLVGRTNQCYVAECQGWYFSYCQMSVDVKEERPGARKKVAGRDPGKGASCYAVADGEDSNRYHRCGRLGAS